MDIPDWDKEQKEILEYPGEDRLLVNAGPGTGKTAVACGRVAYLINNIDCDINPEEILIISFTRAAIKEIRNRIGLYLEFPEDIFSIRIATLDSFAYKICELFDKKFLDTNPVFDQTISHASHLLIENKEASQLIKKLIRHLIIDEAQDIVGLRAQFVIAIMACLDEDAGITVFSDEAQAIYGFSNDQQMTCGKERQNNLPELLRNNKIFSFSLKELLTVHRTTNPDLKRLFTETRQRILLPDLCPLDKYHRVKEDIQNVAVKINFNKLNSKINESSNNDGETLILFRRRLEVLYASYFLAKEQNLQHRIRMSGHPVSIYPWVGACLSEYTSPLLERKTFEELWEENIAGTKMEFIEMEHAWNLLTSVGRKNKNNVVELKTIRSELSKQKPLADFCYPDTGHSGPILGTIHMSKGREAGTIHFIMPRNASEGEDPDDTYSIDYDEESKVLFVGATRGRQSLNVYDGLNTKARTLKSSRLYKIINNKQAKINIEIGLDKDITAEDIAGTYFKENTIKTSQTYLKKIAGSSDSIIWINAKREGDKYLLVPKGDRVAETICSLNSSSIIKDLYIIRKNHFSGVPQLPDYLMNLRIMNVRTIVLPIYQGRLASGLRDPWAQSGFMLAPVITGFPQTFFRWGGN